MLARHNDAKAKVGRSVVAASTSRLCIGSASDPMKRVALPRLVHSERVGCLDWHASFQANAEATGVELGAVGTSRAAEVVPMHRVDAERASWSSRTNRHVS
jgi:hypothetical protein